MDGEEDVWLECHCVCESWWRNGTMEIPHEPISGYKVVFFFFKKKTKKGRSPTQETGTVAFSTVIKQKLA